MIHGTGEQCFVLLPNYYQQVQGGQLQAPKNSSCQDESLCPAKRCPAPPPTCAEEAGASSCSATSSPALRTCEADQSDREWTAECSGRLTAAACRCHIFKSKVNHIVAKCYNAKILKQGRSLRPAVVQHLWGGSWRLLFSSRWTLQWEKQQSFGFLSSDWF